MLNPSTIGPMTRTRQCRICWYTVSGVYGHGRWQEGAESLAAAWAEKSCESEGIDHSWVQWRHISGSEWIIEG